MAHGWGITRCTKKGFSAIYKTALRLDGNLCDFRFIKPHHVLDLIGFKARRHHPNGVGQHPYIYTTKPTRVTGSVLKKT